MPFGGFLPGQSEGMEMRIIVTVIAILVMCSWSVSLAQSPPFKKVTISGEAKTVYNKVSLFEKGSAKKPFKTEYISDLYGAYSIDVDIPYDMKKKNNYLYTDMRFWRDKNENGIKDPGEPISECHFIIWVPSAKIVYMQVYKGLKYQFKSPRMDYDYK